MPFLFFLICFCASTIGAICGVGGGVIIKPLFDALGVMDVATISFLSGCTVLSMSTYSVIKSSLGKHSGFEKLTTIPLAIGGALGGMIGKWLFGFLKNLSTDLDKVGAIQSFFLLIITIGTMLYTLFKKKIVSKKTEGILSCAIIGILLGIISSFLGIGGGPINLVVLFFFFSMSAKKAAETSLYIIFFSQLSSLMFSAITGTIPSFSPLVLAVMILGGISGGVLGRWINKKITEGIVEKLFVGLMAVIICINVYNLYEFL